MAERTALSYLRTMAERNEVYCSMIGMGYYGTITPKVILRNVLENPGWYTAYTPYQAEVSQGRLEALLNFQQVVIDMTGLELASASLLDEATAAAEAMAMAKRVVKTSANVFFVDADTHPQTIGVIETRAHAFGYEVQIGDPARDLDPAKVFAALLSYPGSSGEVRDYRGIIDRLHGAGALAIMATDLLALALLTPPGELGADIATGIGPALRRAHGLWRAACRLLRHPRRIQARHAGPHHRRLGRCRRPPCAAHGDADARAAYPPREGDQQHLHRAGAARRDRRLLRRLQRAQGHPEDGRAHPSPGRDLRVRGRGLGLRGEDQGLLRHGHHPCAGPRPHDLGPRQGTAHQPALRRFRSHRHLLRPVDPPPGAGAAAHRVQDRCPGRHHA